MRNIWAIVSLVITIAVSGAGCVSARVSDQEADRLFSQQKYEETAARLEHGLKAQKENGRDLLLYLLDQGIVYHSAGRYEESNRSFLRADKIAEIKDYTSLATEGATLLSSDNVKDYKGEDFEKVLISTYLAMNYALMGDYENALVEARRVNRKLQLMVTEGKRNYKQSVFARYLSAILYEAEGNYNDAYIDYKETLKLDPFLPGLGRDLWRMAWLLNMHDEMGRWDEKFHLTTEDHAAAKALGPRQKKGEIIVLYENGISPVKRPNPEFHVLPRFYPRFNPVSHAEVLVDGKPQGTTLLLDDIEATAIANLDEKYSGLVARKIAGVVAKEVFADQIERRTNSPLLGALSRIILYQSDRADLRSWNFLPRDLQLARLTVEPGLHTVELSLIGRSGTPVPPKTVQVEAGKKIFVNFRFAPFWW